LHVQFFSIVAAIMVLRTREGTDSDLGGMLEQFAKGTKMFKKILVAYDGSPEAGRALIVGIQLAKSLKADLRTVYVYEKLPAYVYGFRSKRRQHRTTQAGFSGLSNAAG
jgi:hypothetical protein